MFARLFVLFKAVGREIAVLWFACGNPATPLMVKICALLIGLYVISPIDLITDLLPVIGWLDDLTLVAFAVPALLRFVPPAVLEEARMKVQLRWRRGA
jgi:uncharacterized membrane protein YkvA (DUF1232 family)